MVGETHIAKAMGLMIALLCTYPAQSQTLPAPADAGRIKVFPEPSRPEHKVELPVVQEKQGIDNAPKDAKNVVFTLQSVAFEGNTAFDSANLQKRYAHYLGETTLDTVWKIANDVTQHYQAKGYFLSRAYVPAQDVSKGQVTINIVEGYVGEVSLDDRYKKHDLITSYIKRLTAQRPATSQALESFILRLNDLSSIDVSGVLEPFEHNDEGAVRLLLRTQDVKNLSGQVSFDNSGSRFLGPYQATLSMDGSLYALHDTQLYTSVSTPIDELKYVGVTHTVPFYPDWNVELSASYVDSEPGSTLEANDIRSNSTELGVALRYQPIRQRRENLDVSFGLYGKNSNSDIFADAPLSRDRIRTARVSVNYDKADQWNGYNYLSANVVQGLGILGASDEGDANLSRANGDPHFTTAGFSAMRQQFVTHDWLAIGHVSGQVASDPLLSSEEFGFGGRRFGRAYDPSEITGDYGAALSLELRYLDVPEWHEVSFVPYGFYDIGKVWNKGAGGGHVSASSAGMGAHVSHDSGVSANLGVAWPLTKSVDNPISGNDKNPRFLLQLGQSF